LGAKPAAYAIAAPWSAEDLVYVAREAPLNADRIILDYMFQGEAIGYALRPDSPSAIVMHDLFHGRTSGFEAQAASDSTVVVDEAAELGMLARADAVIAIQKAEADFVRSRLAKSSVILAPIAAKPVTTIAPGEDDTLLFVGSGTAPNVLGLQWLFDKVWPTVHAARPRARLRIAGNVSRAFAGAPEGVQFLGPVGDLGPLYDGAGVVISPLNTGSGLKIKLIEAIAQGKAVVATTVTLQGVEAELGPCVSVADEPDAFAQALIGLLGDRAARADLAERALSAARAQFSAEACYRDFVAWLGDAPTAAGSAAETPDRR
jgi:succinoglycan biosynthesis protein ExoO